MVFNQKKIDYSLNIIIIINLLLNPSYFYNFLLFAFHAFNLGLYF